MRTLTLTLDLPDELALRLDAVPADRLSRYALAVFPGLLALDDVLYNGNGYAPAPRDETDFDDAENAEETIDWELVAEVRAADEEVARLKAAGLPYYITFEDYMEQVKADDEAGAKVAMERIRARIAAGQTLGMPDNYRVGDTQTAADGAA